MALHPLDWLIVGAYVLFALTVGVLYAKKAGKDVDQYFLSGRSLPWWIAGTSMVATSFAADTPLVITGWVRDYGIWKNWLWWCYCGGGMLAVFVFARLWRRGGVMTKAEVAELRYGGPAAAVLRGILGFMHASLTNTITLCWVLLAAAKIMDVLLGIDQTLAVTLACLIALVYSLMAGFWGVVVTDLVQFVMAMVGAVALAWLSWDAVGGTEGVLAAAAAGGEFTENTLRLFPARGEGSIFDASFWTRPLASVAIYMGIAWWAAENVDGGGTAIQRIAASKNEREGVLAVMWFNVTHYALRPWPWIMVALASLIVLPNLELATPFPGTITEVTAEAITIEAKDGRTETVAVTHPENTEDWQVVAIVEPDQVIEEGQALAKTDSERAYVVMMKRYLPVGLLGLVVASLLAAFMSTIDTHVNLAASFFVNDLYRRFFVKDADPKHYVLAARCACVGVLLLAGLMASQAKSIADLFMFFLALLSGVGPIYVLRWLWWRVQASTEITAMVSSATATIFLTLNKSIIWNLGPFSDQGKLAAEGRLILVVGFSIVCSLIATFVVKKPAPESLLSFYRKVRPSGWWGPVAALAPDVHPVRGGHVIVVGVIGGIALVYGAMLAVGLFLLDRSGEGIVASIAAAVGAAGVLYALREHAQSTEYLEQQSGGDTGS